MKEVKKAIYARFTGDSNLMGRTGQQGLFLGRLPRNAIVTTTAAAVVLEGETSLQSGFREEHTYTLVINSLSHDLTEDVAGDLLRLFHPTKPSHQWAKLTLLDGSTAFIRCEARIDLPDEDSEWFRKACRFRVRYAKKSP